MGTSSVSSTADNDFWAGLESTIQIILDGDAVGGGAGVTAGSNDPNLLQVEQSESKFSSRSNLTLIGIAGYCWYMHRSACNKKCNPM